MLWLIYCKFQGVHPTAFYSQGPQGLRCHPLGWIPIKSALPGYLFSIPWPRGHLCILVPHVGVCAVGRLPCHQALPFQGSQSAPHRQSLQWEAVFSVPKYTPTPKLQPGQQGGRELLYLSHRAGGRKTQAPTASKAGCLGAFGVWREGHEKCFTPPPYRPALLLCYL